MKVFIVFCTRLTTKCYEGDVKVIFVVGVDYNGKRQAKLREESTKYGDIVQSDVKIDAANATRQYLAGFNWADVRKYR